MSDTSVYNLIIAAFFGGLAAFGVLVSVAKEKDRLWDRYKALKQAEVHQDRVREAKNREKKRVAHKVSLAGEQAPGAAAPRDSAA